MSDLSIVVAVLTYRRPDDLASLLAELVPHASSAAAPAAVVVVDNDELPSAGDLVAKYAGVRYVHEPRPGIAAARNRALDEAGEARLLVFIDDDERPTTGWLDRLVATWQQARPAAVAGPVISTFAAPLDPWVDAGGFFKRLRHSTGTEVELAATNNLLLDLEVVRGLGLRFDDRFGTSGGSDTLFTRSLVRCGGRIVWCDEAIVTDVVPPERATRAWVLRRATRMGNSASRVELALTPPGPSRWWCRMRLAVNGVARIGAGAGRAVYGRFIRHCRHHARGVRMLARGRGMLAGALGTVVAEYERGNTDAATEGRRG